MERPHINKKDTWIRNLNHWRKRVGGREKQRQLGDGWNKHHWRKLSWSCGCWNDRIHLTIKTPVEKGLTWQSRLSWRIGIHIGVWEHHFGKVWNQHLTLKQLEYHNSKQKQRTGLQNKPEQTYYRNFVRRFRGGAHMGSIVQHHHVQGCAHDIRSVPESAKPWTL